MPTKQKKTTTGFVQPIEPASGQHRGELFVINPHEIFAVGHPLVRRFPHLFKPLEPTRDRPAAEQVTAAPGEQRGA